MSEISVQEAYKVMQEHCGIEDKDEVKLLRGYRSYEMGCNLHKQDLRSAIIGVNYFAEIDTWRIKLRNKKGECIGFAPFFCLELVEKTKPEPPPITVGGNEVKFIYGPFPVIEVCGVTVHKKTLQDILKRLEEQN